MNLSRIYCSLSVTVGVLFCLFPAVFCSVQSLPRFNGILKDTAAHIDRSPARPTDEQIGESAVIKLDTGEIRGFVKGGVNVFRGIPFAAPPVGDLRFQSPTAAASWEGIKETILPGKACPQALSGSLIFGDEDCLYLNVYMPVNASAAGKPSLPVFFWIYGGAFTFGDGWEFGYYDATNLVEQHGYIFVSVNYRLSALGLLATDELRSESSDGSAGNMGLKDQRAALQWVQRNIAAFGGDPKRVTIFGESAGAFSVCYHLSSVASFGLFHGAIMESGTCDSADFFFSYDDSKGFSLAFAEIVGCNHTEIQGDKFLQCLRSKTVKELLVPLTLDNLPADAQFVPPLYPAMPWGMTMDNTAAGLSQIPLNVIRSGNWANVPVIGGSNNDEGTILMFMMLQIIPGLTFPITTEDITLVLQHFFANDTVEIILQHYPEYAYKSPGDRAAKMIRDFFFSCAMRRATFAMTAQGQQAWLYHFTYKAEWIDRILLGDYHSFELPFVFANEWPPVFRNFSANDWLMSYTFGDYWSNFVWTGNPNGNSEHHENRSANPFWPTSNSNSMENIVLDVPSVQEDEFLEAQCGFWDTLQTQSKMSHDEASVWMSSL